MVPLKETPIADWQPSVRRHKINPRGCHSTNCMSTKVSVCMQDNWVFDETMKTLDSKRFPLLQLAEMHVMSDLVFGKYDNTDW